MTASLIWATPNAEFLLAKIARVSNPANQENPSYEGLIRYMIKHQHWSPFEMVCAAVEINTTRDIARQILRHRSFHFQEFSQRYADAKELGPYVDREARMQDYTNRQSSLACDDRGTALWWDKACHKVAMVANDLYQEALKAGIAKEQARALLPEGLTPSRMYMQGTLRDWMHYIKLRSGPETQAEHRNVATSVKTALEPVFSATFTAFFGESQ